MPIELASSIDASNSGSVLDLLVDSLGFAFAPPLTREAFLALERPENFRVALDRSVKARGGVVGVLTHQRAGQWFGGTSFSTAGLRCVGVAPEMRGRGVLRRLLGEELRALAKAGVVLSTLYPSSPRVYRSFGYELAGATVFRKLSLANLTAPKALPLEPRLVEAGEEALIEPLHRADGEAREGRIDRGPLGSWWWTRAITKPFASPRPRTYAFMRGERAEGYLVITAYPLDQGRVHLHEWSATTPDAWTTLYGFLSGLRSVTPILSYTADARGTLALGVDVPVEEVAPEASYFGQPTASWMLRVLRPSDLLAGLHYAPGANAELHLALEDALIPENAGHWVLSVRDGRGRFERGGQGRVRLDVRALAALVAGHFDAPTLASAGLVSTDDAASLRSLTALLTRGPSFTWDVF